MHRTVSHAFTSGEPPVDLPDGAPGLDSDPADSNRADSNRADSNRAGSDAPDSDAQDSADSDSHEPGTSDPDTPDPGLRPTAGPETEASEAQEAQTEAVLAKSFARSTRRLLRARVPRRATGALVVAAVAASAFGILTTGSPDDGTVTVPPAAVTSPRGTSTHQPGMGYTGSVLPKPDQVVARAPQPATAAAAQMQTQYLGLLNAERRAGKVAPLTLVRGLAVVAKNWSVKLAAAGQLTHNPDLAGQIHNWEVIGENVGDGTDIPTLDKAFMASAPHRANILYRTFTQVGIGVIVDAEGTVWITIDFKQPSGAATAAPSAPSAPSASAGARPAIPGAFGLTSGATTSVTARFTPVSNAKKYELVNSAGQLAGESTGSPITVPGRTPGRTYSYQLRALGTNGLRSTPTRVHTITVRIGAR